jgi:hypothetical protein
MDSLLKLKLEILYKDLPIEQARQRFDALKQTPEAPKDVPVLKVRRKLRIPAKDSK